MENNILNTKIACYFEGGAGDVLLGHKLASVLKSTIYPQADFSAFLDTEGNPMQEKVLKYLFPSFYKEIFTIPSKKYKKLVIDSQFGQEEVKGFIENVPTDWFEKIMSYDKRYNFHIDSLDFLRHEELEWARYFKIFPRPEPVSPNLIGNYIVSNIYSETGTEHVCENWWAERLVQDLDKLAQKLNYQHIIISTPKLNAKYQGVLQKCKNTHLLNTSVEQVCDIISNSKAVVGIDSAWRLIGHFYNKLVITISKNCSDVGVVPISHQIRWLPFPETTFPLHANTKLILDLLSKMLENQVYRVFPSLSFNERPLDDLLIKRNYTINKEKSILND